jgi:FkbM family methyltransferase
MVNVRNTAKMLVKRPLNALGFDIVRPSVNSTDTRRFEPLEANKFIWLSRLNINTIVDIGAHEGEFAMKANSILPKARIISFEPLADAFRRLTFNMRTVPNFKAFNCALGDRNSTMKIHRNEFTASSSLLRMVDLHREAFPFTINETIETVEVKRLDDVLQGLYLEDYILIKIDVQGYEDRVILGGENVISRAKLLVVETSFQTLYETQPLFDAVYGMLRQRGFAYIGNWDQLISPADGSVLQADAMFVRQ